MICLNLLHLFLLTSLTAICCKERKKLSFDDKIATYHEEIRKADKKTKEELKAKVRYKSQYYQQITKIKSLIDKIDSLEPIYKELYNLEKELIKNQKESEYCEIGIKHYEDEQKNIVATVKMLDKIPSSAAPSSILGSFLSLAKKVTTKITTALGFAPSSSSGIYWEAITAPKTTYKKYTINDPPTNLKKAIYQKEATTDEQVELSNIASRAITVINSEEVFKKRKKNADKEILSLKTKIKAKEKELEKAKKEVKDAIVSFNNIGDY